MKSIKKDIIPFNENDFFSPLRDKTDYAKLILLSSRFLLLNINTKDFKCTSKLKLIIDKMSRLFFYKDAKYYSVAFPFHVELNGKEIKKIRTYSGKIVDHQQISSALSILKSERFNVKPSPLEYANDADNDSETIGLTLLEEIFLFESAYARYENDPIRANGKKHPKVHIDVNYSSYGTYKIGLKKVINEGQFENIFDTSTDCSYLTD